MTRPMASGDPLTYDEIHSMQKRERSTRSVTKVSVDFYERLATYLADAKTGLEEETAKGSSPRLMLLQGQLRNLQEMARDILLMRLHKVTELSFAAVESGSLADKPLTPEELVFAKEVQALVEATKARMMADSPRLAPPAPAVVMAPKPKAAPAPKPPLEAPPAAPAPKVAPPKAAPAPPPAQEALALLRILEDLPPFEGEDGRVYKLKREDVISLPRAFSQILIRRKKAVELPVPP
jgi:DNA replication initiation complex subunit (GINS family)